MIRLAPFLVYKRLLAKSSSKPVNHTAVLTRCKWLVNLRWSILSRFIRIFEILSAISHTFTSLGSYYPSIQERNINLCKFYFHCLKGTSLLPEQENERKWKRRLTFEDFSSAVDLSSGGSILTRVTPERSTISWIIRPLFPITFPSGRNNAISCYS